jgi:hypothetical protein
MPNTHETILKKYLQLPERLEAAIAGLSEADLDLTLGEGWSIRQYVHHTVEGELMWQVNLRVIIGTNGVEFPFRWYFALPQDEWVQRWAYDKRPLAPTLALFRAGTRTLADLLRNVPPETCDHYGRVTWPGDDKETRLTARDILLIHVRHMDQHTADIRAIRAHHSLPAGSDD